MIELAEPGSRADSAIEDLDSNAPGSPGRAAGLFGIARCHFVRRSTEGSYSSAWCRQPAPRPRELGAQHFRRLHGGWTCTRGLACLFFYQVLQRDIAEDHLEPATDEKLAPALRHQMPWLLHEQTIFRGLL
ncbi:MAG TPA: hypothetical protein VMK12_15245 [Anaeromyxobacteraceae bacterium]|nr:hypothetical protein [Anaeromyxobacteraceae bacterium]